MFIRFLYVSKFSYRHHHLLLNNIMSSSKKQQFLIKLNNMEMTIKHLVNQIETIKREFSESYDSGDLQDPVVSSDKVQNDNETRQLSRKRKKLSSEDDVDTLSIKVKRSDNLNINHDFNIDSDGYVVVYTDGACSNNGQQHAKAGLGVWFGPNHKLNIAEPVQGRPTNNVGEIQACIRAIEIVQNAGYKKIAIHTDSEFTINCMTKWINGWIKKNWVTSTGNPVKNKDELIILQSKVTEMDHVKWVHINGHVGITGNEEADKLARKGASMYKSVK